MGHWGLAESRRVAIESAGSTGFELELTMRMDATAVNEAPSP